MTKTFYTLEHTMTGSHFTMATGYHDWFSRPEHIGFTTDLHCMWSTCEKKEALAKLDKIHKHFTYVKLCKWTKDD